MATECEAPFRFDPDNMSPNMSLCGSGRNYIKTFLIFLYSPAFYYLLYLSWPLSRIELSPVSYLSEASSYFIMCIFNNGSLLAYTILYYTIGNLTIRNNANKKWSTVRANKRMSSGLHRWDVVIDRLAVLRQVGNL